jgi:hypothetical protein
MPHAEPLTKASRPESRTERRILRFMALLATLHVIWFYIENVPSVLSFVRYENSAERMPFQGRLLMELPLRWAHSSHTLIHASAWLSDMHTWMPRGVYPEDLVELPIYLVSVITAGLVAMHLYRAHSKTGLLTPFVYPAYLVMVAVSYCLVTSHYFRYVYDLPSLGLFAAGLYLIHTRRNPFLFIALFVIATLNRETTLFLLYFFVITSCIVEEKFLWRRALTLRVAGTVVFLSTFWIAWHVFINHHFAGLESEAKPRVLNNLITTLWPLAYPQIFGVAAYTLPILLFFRTRSRNLKLRLWLWVVPAWALFMLFYGMFIEIRLFGELIPVFTCAIMLLAEERLTQPSTLP